MQDFVFVELFRGTLFSETEGNMTVASDVNTMLTGHIHGNHGLVPLKK